MNMKIWEAELEELLHKSTKNYTDKADELAVGRKTVKEFLKKVKQQFISQTINQEEEVLFFKTIKPKLQMQLILFNEKYNLTIRLPYGNGKHKAKFIHAQKNRVAGFIDRHIDFLAYMRRGCSDRDIAYFTREGLIEAEGEYLDFDPSFGTYYSTLYAHVLAYEQLYFWLDRLSVEEKVLEQLSMLEWKSSKIKLIELGYALHAAGVFGSIEIREIMKVLEVAFNIKLGNYYDAFLKNIRLRKIDPTIFLNELRTALTNRMDDLTEHPKYQ